jgi:hypothetical protein
MPHRHTHPPTRPGRLHHIPNLPIPSLTPFTATYPTHGARVPPAATSTRHRTRGHLHTDVVHACHARRHVTPSTVRSRHTQFATIVVARTTQPHASTTMYSCLAHIHRRRRRQHDPPSHPPAHRSWRLRRIPNHPIPSRTPYTAKHPTHGVRAPPAVTSTRHRTRSHLHTDGVHACHARRNVIPSTVRSHITQFPQQSNNAHTQHRRMHVQTRTDVLHTCTGLAADKMPHHHTHPPTRHWRLHHIPNLPIPSLTTFTATHPTHGAWAPPAATSTRHRTRGHLPPVIVHACHARRNVTPSTVRSHITQFPTTVKQRNHTTQPHARTTTY